MWTATWGPNATYTRSLTRSAHRSLRSDSDRPAQLHPRAGDALISLDPGHKSTSDRDLSSSTGDMSSRNDLLSPRSVSPTPDPGLDRRDQVPVSLAQVPLWPGGSLI